MTATTVQRIPLYGIPCGVCARPATVMDTIGTWSRTWHARATRTTVALYCDVGTPPEHNAASNQPVPLGRPA